MVSTPRRCSAMMTSLPSSPLPSSMTRVADGDSGVPIDMAGTCAESAILLFCAQHKTSTAPLPPGRAPLALAVACRRIGRALRLARAHVKRIGRQRLGEDRASGCRRNGFFGRGVGSEREVDARALEI